MNQTRRLFDDSLVAKATERSDLNIIACVKGEQHYIFLYDDTGRSDTLMALGRYASNPELNFTWYDAAVLSRKIRRAANHTVDEFDCGGEG